MNYDMYCKNICISSRKSIFFNRHVLSYLFAFFTRLKNENKDG